VPEVLIAADSEALRDEIRSVLSGLEDVVVREVDSGANVLPAVVRKPPDLAVFDMQIGNMGGFATTLELRLAESSDRTEHVPVLLLIDRRPDVFLARRSGAEGWIIKPLDPIRLRKAVTALLAGDTYHDPSFQPTPVLSASPGSAEG
jgi:DNA-binding NarL/FixJ family response regulator